jgi:predicted Ser/Thr protein kinase
MDERPKCKVCGAPLTPEAPEGLCPKCLLKAGFDSAPGAEAGKKFTPLGVHEVAQLFPQLELLELIGKGGMGAVYKARQPGLDRLVALKTLAPPNGSDPGFAERFTREARALAKLSHPNIVAVYDFGQVGTPDARALHYFVMEFVDGANLRQLEQEGRLTPRQALEIIPQICEALQYAHDEGIVHRDIKPENVLLDKKGRVKIADFGLAKIVGTEARDLRLTGVRDVMGTPHYMAPEQVEHPQAVDHRADIYSLGVVFYEMLTGELPLGKFAPPSCKVQVDVRLDEVVLHALEKEPDRRYQQARQVKTDVQIISETPPLRVSPAVGATSTPGQTAGATRHRSKAILTAFAALAAVGLVAWASLSLMPGSQRSQSRPNLLVAGTVRDITGQPIQGARVADNDYGVRADRSPQEAWTDASGHYELKTWYEEHSLSASAPGHHTALATVLTGLSNPGKLEMDFQLRLAPGSPLPMPPVVLKTVPQSGAAQVDPALTELRVTFSAPMLDGSWSWTTWGEENFPKVTGEIHYLKDGCTCVLPVRLERGKLYATWLNSEKFQNFRDRQGRPAVPYLLIFQTRK